MESVLGVRECARFWTLDLWMSRPVHYHLAIHPLTSSNQEESFSHSDEHQPNILADYKIAFSFYIQGDLV